MIRKFISMWAVLFLLFAFGYGVNRLSTVFHPMGNWIVGAIVVSMILGFVAWMWDDRRLPMMFDGLTWKEATKKKEDGTL